MSIIEKSYLSSEDLISLPTLSDINISEDGQHVAFVRTTADWKDNAYRHHIWMYEKNEEGYSLTSNDREGTSPLWSPDSRHIAYLGSAGDGDEKNQIFVESIHGQNRAQITDEKEGVSQFKWEPTGKGLYYVAQSKESEEIKGRKEIEGDFHHAGREDQNHCLYYRELGSDNSVYQLTDGKDFHIRAFDLSSKGDKIVWMATPSPDGEDDLNRDLYILDLPSRHIHKLNRNKLLGESVCFSPDATKICYTASIREKDYYKTRIKDRTLEIYHLTSGEVTQPLMEVDPTVTPIRWTAKGILIRWQDHTNVLLGLLSEDGKVDMLSETTDCFIMEASISENGDHLSYSKATSNETFEIYLDDKKISNENRLFKEKQKSNREIISWKSSDDLEIEGVLSTPADFDPNKQYPLLVLIHGGPDWASFPIHSGCFNEKYPVEPFIEKGFIVLEPNYRGSSGYGKEFLKASYRNLGIGDYQDVISGVDELIHRGMADKDRVGVMGWSQGGFISAFCTTYSDRFKAISVGGGITNWRNHYENTDMPSFIRMYLGDTPWNDPEIYMKTSPMTYLPSACTPTLIQHGEKDARVPASNAYELYQGLKDMDVKTELMIFKGMAYRSDQPRMNLAIMKQNLMWFSHYLLGESMKDFRVL
ncbi:S9 family peptidase [Bacillus sp. RO3]|nr:S9 family peptidase [Bacillus sp. RO3]